MVYTWIASWFSEEEENSNSGDRAEYIMQEETEPPKKDEFVMVNMFKESSTDDYIYVQSLENTDSEQPRATETNTKEKKRSFEPDMHERERRNKRFRVNPLLEMPTGQPTEPSTRGEKSDSGDEMFAVLPYHAESDLVSNYLKVVKITTPEIDEVLANSFQTVSNYVLRNELELDMLGALRTQIIDVEQDIRLNNKEMDTLTKLCFRELTRNDISVNIKDYNEILKHPIVVYKGSVLEEEGDSIHLQYLTGQKAQPKAICWVAADENSVESENTETAQPKRKRNRNQKPQKMPSYLRRIDSALFNDSVEKCSKEKIDYSWIYKLNLLVDENLLNNNVTNESIERREINPDRFPSWMLKMYQLPELEATPKESLTKVASWMKRMYGLPEPIVAEPKEESPVPTWMKCMWALPEQECVVAEKDSLPNLPSWMKRMYSLPEVEEVEVDASKVPSFLKRMYALPEIDESECTFEKTIFPAYNAWMNQILGAEDWDREIKMEEDESYLFKIDVDSLDSYKTRREQKYLHMNPRWMDLSTSEDWDKEIEEEDESYLFKIDINSYSFEHLPDWMTLMDVEGIDTSFKAPSSTSCASFKTPGPRMPLYSEMLKKAAPKTFLEIQGDGQLTWEIPEWMQAMDVETINEPMIMVSNTVKEYVPTTNIRKPLYSEMLRKGTSSNTQLNAKNRFRTNTVAPIKMVSYSEMVKRYQPTTSSPVLQSEMYTIPMNASSLTAVQPITSSLDTSYTSYGLDYHELVDFDETVSSEESLMFDDSFVEDVIMTNYKCRELVLRSPKPSIKVERSRSKKLHSRPACDYLTSFYIKNEMVKGDEEITSFTVHMPNHTLKDFFPTMGTFESNESFNRSCESYHSASLNLTTDHTIDSLLTRGNALEYCGAVEEISMERCTASNTILNVASDLMADPTYSCIAVFLATCTLAAINESYPSTRDNSTVAQCQTPESSVKTCNIMSKSAKTIQRKATISNKKHTAKKNKKWMKRTNSVAQLQSRNPKKSRFFNAQKFSGRNGERAC